ncbi:MAG TPA: hypothetical protein VGN16_09425 [Acidobacteriaceae bacterium]|jgi:hypothetical protein
MKHAFDIDALGFAPQRWSRYCSFGIGEAIAGITAALSSGIGAGATALGIGESTAGIIGGIGAGALEGSALGTAQAAITGQDLGKGALGGAISGGVLSGAGGPLGNVLGSSTAGNVLAGAAGGTLGNAATGRDLGQGALGGAISGGISSALASPKAGAAGAGGPGAAAGAAPSSVAASGPDLTGIETVTSTAPRLGGDINLGGLAGGLGGGGNQAVGQQKGDQPGSGVLSSNAPGGQLTSAGAASSVPSNVSGVKADTQIGAGAASAAPAAAGPAAAPATQVGTGAETSFDKFLDNPSLSSGFNVLKQNPLEALGAGALGFDLLSGNQQPAGSQQLNTLANQDIASGHQLQSYLTSGALPPGMQASLNTANSAANAAIRQKYANMGMSGSSAEAQDLANVQQQSAAQAGTLATQLFQAGTQQSQLGQQLYEELMKVNMEQDQGLSSSIGNFVSAFAGMGRPIQINTGTAQ